MSGDERVYAVPSAALFGTPIPVIDLAGHANSYRMEAVCINCKWTGQVRIACGQRASRGIAAKGYECPACDCATVEPTTLVARDTPEDDSRTHMERRRKTQEKMAAQDMDRLRWPV